MKRIATLVLALGLGALHAVRPDAASAQSAAAAQVCADIMAQYGIAPEGCDPDQDARSAVNEAGRGETGRGETGRAPASGGAGAQQRPEIDPMQLDSNIFFPGGGDTLDPAARARLDLLAQVMATRVMRSACLRLVGHSDVSGPAALNEEIARKRALAVAAYLRPALPQPRQLEEILSEGERAPLAGIAPEDARNRRVTIYARVCPDP